MFQKTPGSAGLARQVAQHRPRPRRDLLPADRASLYGCTAEMSVAGPATQHCLAHRGDRAGRMHVGAEVAALVDAGQHPRRPRAEAVQGHAHAIGRRRLRRRIGSGRPGGRG